MMPINGQTPGPAEQQQAQPAFRRSTGAVASLARMFELNGAAERQQGAGGNNDSGGARQQWKRQRLASGTHPPLPSEWMSSPPLARGDCGADGSPAAPVERQLWEEKSDGGTAEAAREARLAKIRAKFGTKRFYPARELLPAELRSQLGASEADLAPEDYKLRRWDPAPVDLASTSNAFARNWVLTGQSGCVGLASSATFLFVLGAGQTIYLEEADSVVALREEGGVALQLGADSCEGRVTLKVPDAAVAADMVATINSRAATRAALRQKQAAAVAAAQRAEPAAEPAAE